MVRNDRTLYCDFCGQSQHEVVKLIAAPGVCICDFCTAISADIVFGTVRVALDEHLNPVSVTRVERKESGDLVRSVIWQRPIHFAEQLTFVFEEVPKMPPHPKAV